MTDIRSEPGDCRAGTVWHGGAWWSTVAKSRQRLCGLVARVARAAPTDSQVTLTVTISPDLATLKKARFLSYQESSSHGSSDDATGDDLLSNPPSTLLFAHGASNATLALIRSGRQLPIGQLSFTFPRFLALHRANSLMSADLFPFQGATMVPCLR